MAHFTQYCVDNWDKYEYAISLLDKIIFLLVKLDSESYTAAFDDNQREIKQIMTELWKSELPLDGATVTTVEFTLVTGGGIGNRYTDVWRLVGEKIRNPFLPQPDGSAGIGHDSLFSVGGDELVQEMPNTPYYSDGQYDEPPRFLHYGTVVLKMKEKVEAFLSTSSQF